MEGKALNQIQPCIDRKSGDHKLYYLGKLLHLLQQAVKDQDNRATANKECLKLKMQDCEFSLYSAKFQQWVPDVNWNEVVEFEVPRQDLSKKLDDLWLHCDIVMDHMEFVK
jgi:hypothetical protein